MEIKEWMFVLWLYGLECICCFELFICFVYFFVKDVVLLMILLDYDDILMVFVGYQVEVIFEEIMQKYKGKYILVVEGNLLFNEDGMFCIVGGKLFLDQLKYVVKDVVVIIVWGFCVFWGCVQVVCFNLMQVVFIYKVIKDKLIIKVLGCLFIVEVMIGVIIYMLIFGKVFEFDCQGCLKMFYSQCIYDKCYCCLYFDVGQFVEQWDDEGVCKGYCLYKVGCKGLIMYNVCLMVCWNEGILFFIQVGYGCIGCLEDGFWDKGFFYDCLIDINQFGIELNVDEVGIVVVGGVGVVIVVYVVVSVIKCVQYKGE